MNEIRGFEREKNLDKKEYLTKSYFSHNQLWSWSEQIYHIANYDPKNMIEIGVGNGFTALIYRQLGIDVITVDINNNLNPDYNISVLDIRKYFKKAQVQLISCCEVFEHIPFIHFEDVIRDISEISQSLFLTLPMYNRIYGIGAYTQLPRLNRWFTIWMSFRKTKDLAPPHFWEINYNKETSIHEIKRILSRYFKIIDTDLFKLNPTHRYFFCKK